MSDGPEYDVDLREHPEEYDIGRGEAGVFNIEPYRSELLPLWGYGNRETAEAVHERFREYREAAFVFKEHLETVRDDETYRELKNQHRKRHD